MKLNISGTFVSERIARTILTKVLLKEDPGYVDMMNPCGAGRAVMSYAPDGGCYPTDEARMLGDNIFLDWGISWMKVMIICLIRKICFFFMSAGCSDLWKSTGLFAIVPGLEMLIPLSITRWKKTSFSKAGRACSKY